MMWVLPTTVTSKVQGPATGWQLGDWMLWALVAGDGNPPEAQREPLSSRWGQPLGVLTAAGHVHRRRVVLHQGTTTMHLLHRRSYIPDNVA